MALLSSCWMIIEFYLIPDGSLKSYFYLSFYINPFFLFFCQIFLWLKKLQRWFFVLLFFPSKIYYFVISLFISIFSLLTKRKPENIDLFYDAMEQEVTQDCDHHIVGNGSRFQPRLILLEMEKSSEDDIWFDANDDGVVFTSFKSDSTFQYNHNHSCTMDTVQRVVADSRCNLIRSFNEQFSNGQKLGGFKSLGLPRMTHSEDVDNADQDKYCRGSWLDEYLSSEHYSRSLITYDDHDNEEFNDDLEDTEIFSPRSLSTVDHDDHERLSTFHGSDLLIDALEQEYSIRRSVEEDVDTFHQTYTERMRFFDALYHERLYGLKSISDERLTSPVLHRNMDSPLDFSMQYISWRKMIGKRILRSLEHDFELIYVAQTCLLWEALHQRYQKVEALVLSNTSENRIFFNTNIEGKFQEFRILLVRFMEDQKSQDQGSSSFTNNRISFQSLLEVPEVKGYTNEENNMGEEATRVTEVLKAIWKCIKAFWLYVNIDNQKPLWTYKGIFRRHPPVEDPKDLELLHQVTKALHKKMMLLRDVQGKRKCWLRRKVEPLQAEDEKRNVLFATIDMKLVQMLLKMSMISTSHLNWCKEKLNNLEFRTGKLLRVPTSHLFPSS